MIQRTLEPTLRKVAGQYPVVTLTGPRQSGKTTLVRSAFGDHRYASLEAHAAGHEIDFLVELGGERLAAVEAKSGQTIAADFFAGLEHWRLLAGDPAAPAALIQGGGETLRRWGFAVYSWAVL